MSTKELLTAYYDGLAKRAGWQSAVSETLRFMGTGSVPGDPVSSGKSGYARVLERFGQRFEAVRMKESVVDGSRACVVATYDLVSPKGRKLAFDILEYWGVEDGRLASLTLYFDTAAYNAFMKD